MSWVFSVFFSPSRLCLSPTPEVMLKFTCTSSDSECFYLQMMWRRLLPKYQLCVNLRRTLWVRNYPHLRLLPHNSSSLWCNAMKVYDLVNEGLVPVLTETGVSGWINISVNKQQSCIKPSVCLECVHTHTLTVELLCAIRRGCGGTHALQRSRIYPLCAVHHGCGGTHALQRSIRPGCRGTHAFWRARIESFPCVLALSAVILLWSVTGTTPCSCFLGRLVLTEILSHLLFATNLRLFGFIRVDLKILIFW